MGFGEEDHRVPFSSNHVNSTYYQHNVSLLILMLFTWMRKCLSGFSTIKLFSPTSLLSYCPFWKASHYAQPKPKEWGVIFHFLKGKVSTSIIWNYFVWEICLYSPLIYVFNHFLNSTIDSKILILLGMVLETKIWALGIPLRYHCF